MYRQQQGGGGEAAEANPEALLCAHQGGLQAVLANLKMQPHFSKFGGGRRSKGGGGHGEGEEGGGRVEGGDEMEVFSLIVCTQVLGRVESPLVALLEMYSVLKRGGMLLLTVPALERALSPPPPSERDRPHLGLSQHRFTESDVRKLLQQSGLCIVTLRTAGNSMTTSGYMLGMSSVDLPDADRLDSPPTPTAQQHASSGSSSASSSSTSMPPGDLLRYYGVYALAQRPPCSFPFEPE